ncbi:hypothetical protein PYCCODRAFT_1439269 [Trametes coccinea BRFM310]|uniref:Secreted protein n=1 Tax=Trametes coccinea (strain BRFM310) TaxID=1353009 RepID=A0A1Y2IB79_TRAC3|nr:hypothetical protein PYCCODRAFT_1439269 [Trametes coccinea BRFM310]
MALATLPQLLLDAFAASIFACWANVTEMLRQTSPTADYQPDKRPTSAFSPTSIHNAFNSPLYSLQTQRITVARLRYTLWSVGCEACGGHLMCNRVHNSRGCRLRLAVSSMGSLQASPVASLYSSE